MTDIPDTLTRRNRNGEPIPPAPDARMSRAINRLLMAHQWRNPVCAINAVRFKEMPMAQWRAFGFPPMAH